MLLDRHSQQQIYSFNMGVSMFTELENGKAGVVLVLIVVGVVAVGGLMINLFNSTDGDKPEDLSVKKVVPGETKIINEVEEEPVLDSEVVKEEEEEEKPTLIRTVDGQGNTTWISTEEVDIYQPGKGKTIKARKIATATGRKMKPMPLKAESAAKMVHPSIEQMNNKRKAKLTNASKGEGDEDTKTSTGDDEGDKMGKGKGAGSGGGDG
jgi:hypothetical protein